MDNENRLTAIYTAPKAGDPMVGRSIVMLREGVGIEDDRYGTKSGFYSQTKRPVIRHLTIISRDEILAQNKLHGTQFTIAQTRRNFLISHPTISLYDLIGREFSIAGVILFGVEICTPCNRPSTLCGQMGFEKVFKGMGGIRVEVRSSGLVELSNRLEF